MPQIYMVAATHSSGMLGDRGARSPWRLSERRRFRLELRSLWFNQRALGRTSSIKRSRATVEGKLGLPSLQATQEALWVAGPWDRREWHVYRSLSGQHPNTDGPFLPEAIRDTSALLAEDEAWSAGALPRSN